MTPLSIWARTLSGFTRKATIDYAHDALEFQAARPYLPDHATWLKVRNQQYSQWVGREELFERERSGDRDFQI